MRTFADRFIDYWKKNNKTTIHYATNNRLSFRPS